MPDNDDLALRDTLIREAYRQGRIGIPMTLVAIASLAWIHWLDGHHLFSPVWLTGSTLVQVIRGLLLVHVSRHQERIPLIWRERLYVIPLHLTSLCWALLPIVVLPVASDHEKFGTMCILAGMAGGAATLLASLNWSARLYLFCMLIPASLIVELDTISPVIRTLGVCFFAVMLLGHASARHVLIDAISKRLQNQRLLRAQEQQNAAIDQLNHELRIAEAALRQQNADLEQEVAIRTERNRLAFAVIENTAEGVMVTDTDDRIVGVNPAFTRITGYGAEEVIGCIAAELRPPLHDDAGYQLAMIQLRESGRWDGELWSQRKDGTRFLERRTVDAVRNPEGETSHYVSVFNDITDDFRKDEQLRYMACHDPLTGLANRTLLHERMCMAIAHAERARNGFAVFFLDLDQFKSINDTLGHDVGDLLLKAVGIRLQSCLRATDTLSRLGGDEFVVLLTDIKHREDCALLARKLMQSLEKPLEIAGKHLHARTSIGIAVYPEDGTSVDTLMKNADMALYAAKAAGKNRFEHFLPSMFEQAATRHELETALREALQNRELCLHYQPKVAAADGRIEGFEALLRWPRPGYGFVSPEIIIPIAESSSLIDAIGEQVIDQACAQLADWHARGFAWQRVAVNVSVHQLVNQDLPAIVRDALARHGVPASTLAIEVTESVLMSRPDKTLHELSELRAMGIRIAIDDFGTGHSSLSYLRHLPVDELKIDRAFVIEAESNPTSQAIIRTIVSLSQALGKLVVAEGVETVAQALMLRAAGCDQFQGFLFAPGLEPAELEARQLLATASGKVCIKKIPGHAGEEVTQE